VNIDATLVSTLCGAASAVIGLIVEVVQLSRMGSSNESGSSPTTVRRNKKLVSLGWGICGFLTTATFLCMALHMGRIEGADMTLLWAIGVFLFLVLCIGTWVIS
jgi:hypothetical protein